MILIAGKEFSGRFWSDSAASSSTLDGCPWHAALALAAAMS
jgi:hypothetical protein